MKSINFIDPVPPQKQRDLVYWFYGSALTILALIAGMIIIHYTHVRICRTAIQELTELQENAIQIERLSSKKKLILGEQQEIKNHLHALGGMRQKAGSAHRLLRLLARITPTNVCLLSLDGEVGARINITGQAYDAKAAVTFLELLNACPYIDNMQLSSMSEHKEMTTFTCYGTWKDYQETTDTRQESIQDHEFPVELV